MTTGRPCHAQVHAICHRLDAHPQVRDLLLGSGEGKGAATLDIRGCDLNSRDAGGTHPAAPAAMTWTVTGTVSWARTVARTMTGAVTCATNPAFRAGIRSLSVPTAAASPSCSGVVPLAVMASTATARAMAGVLGRRSAAAGASRDSQHDSDEDDELDSMLHMILLRSLIQRRRHSKDPKVLPPHLNSRHWTKCPSSARTSLAPTPPGRCRKPR